MKDLNRTLLKLQVLKSSLKAARELNAELFESLRQKDLKIVQLENALYEVSNEPMEAH